MQAAGALRADWDGRTDGQAGDILCDICNLLCPRREGGSDGCYGVSFNLVGRNGAWRDDETERERLMLFLPCLTVCLTVRLAWLHPAY